MKMKRKSLISFILVFSLVFSMVVPAAAQGSEVAAAGDTPTVTSGTITHDSSIKLKKEGAYKYVAIGDSTAAGYSIDDAEGSTSQALQPWTNYKGSSSVSASYPAQFAAKLLSELKTEGIIDDDSDFSWSNLGVSSYQMYDYYRVLIDKSHTSVLFNNMLSLSRKDVDATKAKDSQEATDIRETAEALKNNDTLNNAQKARIEACWTAKTFYGYGPSIQDTVAGYIKNYYAAENSGKDSLYVTYGIKYEKESDVPWYSYVKDLNPSASDYTAKLAAALNNYLYVGGNTSAYNTKFNEDFMYTCYLAISDDLVKNAVSGSFLFYELFQQEIPTADLISINIGANDLLEQFMFDLVRTSAGRNADSMDGMSVTGTSYTLLNSQEEVTKAFNEGNLYKLNNYYYYYYYYQQVAGQTCPTYTADTYYSLKCEVDNVFMFVTWAALYYLMSGQEMSSVVITAVELLDELLPLRYNGDQEAMLEDIQETLEYLDADTVEEHIMDNGVKAMEYYQMVVNMIKRGGTFPNIAKKNLSGSSEEDEYGQLYFATKSGATDVKFDFDKLDYTVGADGKCTYTYDGKAIEAEYTVTLEPLNKDAQIMYVGGFNPFGTDEWYDGTYYSNFNTAIITIQSLFNAYRTNTLSAGNLATANLELADMLVSLVENSTASITSDTSSQMSQFLKGTLTNTHSFIDSLKDAVSRVQELFKNASSSSAASNTVVKSENVEGLGNVTTSVTTIDENNNPSAETGGTIKLKSYDSENKKLSYEISPASGYFPYGYTAEVSWEAGGKTNTTQQNLMYIRSYMDYSTYTQMHYYLLGFSQSVTIPDGATDVSIKVVYKKAKTWNEMVEYASTTEGKKEIYSLIKAELGTTELSLGNLSGIVDKLVAAITKEYGTDAFAVKSDTELMKLVKTDLIIALLLEEVGFSEASALELGMTIGLVIDDTSYPVMYTLLGKPGMEACNYEDNLINQYSQDAELGGPFVSIVDMPNENNMNPHPLSSNHAYIAEQMFDALISNVNVVTSGQGTVYGPASKKEGTSSYSVLYNFDANFVVEPAAGYTFKYYIDGKEYTPKTKTVTVDNVKKDTELKIVFYQGEWNPAVDPSIAIDSGNISINKGDSKQIKATTNQDGAAIKWESSDSDIVSIDQNGNIKALKEGTSYIKASITVEGETYYDSIKVTVTNLPGSLSLDKSKVEIAVGKTAEVVATITPDTADQTITWTSADTSIATVDKNGVITGKKAGNTTITATDAAGHKVTVAVVVKAQEELPSTFVDVTSSDYFYNAVEWAAAMGVTSGIDATHFGPNLSCTRAQMVTFLWRAMGCPEPKSTSTPFTDVVKGSYYEKAVAWAVENGITKGMTATTFGVNNTVTRGQAVTFLARTAKVADNATGYTHSFTDVTAKDYYNNAVAWAATKGITEGKTSALFAPKDDCTRAQIVTFLYRYVNGVK